MTRLYHTDILQFIKSGRGQAITIQMKSCCKLAVYKRCLYPMLSTSDPPELPYPWKCPNLPHKVPPKAPNLNLFPMLWHSWLPSHHPNVRIKPARLKLKVRLTRKVKVTLGRKVKVTLGRKVKVKVKPISTFSLCCDTHGCRPTIPMWGSSLHVWNWKWDSQEKWKLL